MRFFQPRLRIFRLIMLLALPLTGCARQALTPAPTVTYAPCAPENIVAETKKVNDLQRAFDDASQLASVTPLSQLTAVIPSMQETRRQAQDQQVPACLNTLKTLQLQQMNTVINTFLAFLAGGSQNPNNQLLSQGIAQARLLHEQYNQELAHLIGATYIPPVVPTAAASATPAFTQTP